MVHSNRILKDALLHISNEVKGEAASVINRVPNKEHVLRGSTTPHILKVSAHHTERNGNEEKRPKFPACYKHDNNLQIKRLRASGSTVDSMRRRGTHVLKKN